MIRRPNLAFVLVLSLAAGSVSAQSTPSSATAEPNGEGGGSCTLSVSPSHIEAGTAGATATISVTPDMQYGCSWQTSTQASWVHLDTTSGYGMGTIGVTVDEYIPPATNPCTARSAVIYVGSVYVLVVQAPAPNPNCVTQQFPQPTSSSSCCTTKAAKLVSTGTTSLELARQYRDEVLSRTPEGRELVAQYYAHTGEVVQFMAMDPWFTFRAARLLERHTDTLRAAVAGKASLSPAEVDDIDSILAQIQVGGSPDLASAVAAFRLRLRTPEIQEVCGIAIAPPSGAKAELAPRYDSAPYVGIAPTSDSTTILPLRIPDVLAVRARGRAYADLYMKHAAEATRLIMADPALALRTMSAMGQLAPILGRLVNDGQADVPERSLRSLDGILENLQQRGSPGLRAALARVRTDLRAPRILAGFGLRQIATAEESRADRSLPLAFVPSRSDGSYVARGSGYGIRVASDRFGVRMRRPAGATTASTTDETLVGFSFVGARATRSLAADAPLDTRVTELVGDDRTQWRSGIPSFGRVVSRDLYAGVDVAFSGTQRRLSTELRLAPHADPAAVVMSVSGAARIDVNEEGDLLFRLSGRETVQRRPDAFQIIDGRRRSVEARYALSGARTVGLRLGVYDRARPLVVAQSVDLAAYFGGPGDDGASDLAVDGAGNLYVTGFANAGALPDANGLQTNFGGGGGDAFVMKLDPTGRNVLYATFLGGRGQDFAGGIAVDAEGSAYVCGATASSDFPTAHRIQNGLKGTFDGFVAKLDPTGTTLLFSTQLGGSSLDTASGIAVDSAGLITVCGATSSEDFPTTVGAFARAPRGLVDVVVAKIDPTAGKLIYSARFGGNGHDGASDVAVDAGGNAVVVGATASNDFPTLNAAQQLFGGFVEGFVTRISSDGHTLLSSTFLGGDDLDGCGGVALDGTGAIYVTGATASPNFPVVSPAQATFGGGYLDAFVVKLAADARTIEYATYLGGSDDDRGYRIAVDAEGRAYLAGITNSQDFPTRGAAQPSLVAGTFDAFAASLNPAGNSLVYSTYVGGTGDEAAIGVAIDPEGNGVFVGETSSPDLPGALGFAGAYDAFVLRIPAAPSVPPPVIGQIGAIDKRGKPFRIKITGSNFQSGVVVTISGSPWPTVTRKGETRLILKKGPALEALFPVGQAVDVTLSNPDGGVARETFTRR